MSKAITIEYKYVFRSGMVKNFAMVLDQTTLDLQVEKRPAPPPWALLNHKKCENCPLADREHPYCPVARNFADIAEQFKDLVSHEHVTVVVTTEERQYSKATTVQQGLSPLIGIIMTTSGCPIMDHLKPMVRFHLPFASLEETIFRMASMYLMAQYFQKQDGKSPAWNLDGLANVYTQVGIVNRDFALRLRDAAKKDANVNALVNLDCFAQMVPLAADDLLREIKPYFAAYL
ncbi:MAG: hypothetical protein M0R70_02410 [Nitrospirae bacterium]|nr:hypothetical protein [Nitrospirota bacterium]